MTDSDIMIEDLCFQYPGGHVALEHIDMYVKCGSISALLGANGSGKSTLLQCMAGLLRPQHGKIYIQGKPIASYKKELYKKVGMIFQNPDDQLFEPTVSDDIAYGLINLGFNTFEIHRAIDRITARLNIGDMLDKSIGSLSCGEKKKVAIAGVLVMQPDILLLDEPTSGLDPLSAYELMQLVKDISISTGVSVIVATHDVDMVPVFCDYVFVLQAGHLCLSGSPEEVFMCKKAVRDARLRLPRIEHLVEILHRDGMNIDTTCFTIGQARRQLLKLVGKK